MTAMLAIVALFASQAGASAIRVNGAGAEAGRAATVALAIDGNEPVAWRLLNATGQVAARGEADAPVAAPRAGGRVTTVRLPATLAAGTYRVEVDGEVSRDLIIAERPFQPLFRDAMSFFYQQRAGVPITADLVQRPDLARVAGHTSEVVSCFAGTDERGLRWPGCPERTDVTGGWYDAGDRGKYIVNGGITVWTLLDVYQRSKASELMHDGALAVPERGNGVSDLLDEVRFELEWMLRMQLPAGARAAVADGDAIRWIDDAGGLVHQKVADLAWTAVPLRIEDDTGPRALYPPSTAATLNLAAVAAQASGVWRSIDPAFADRLAAAAKAAWKAAQRHPALLADARFAGSGGYGDENLNDEFFWAAAEIALLDPSDTTATRVIGSHVARPEPASEIGWNSVATAGLISILRAPANVLAPTTAAARRAIVAAADALLADRDAQAWRYPGPRGDTVWGSNGALLNRAIVLGTAFDLTGDARYRQAVTDALDYVLGRNPLDRSYVSGYGARPMRFPHHRFWGAGIDPAYPEPPPGVLSGGPNSRALADDVARAMRGRCLPETCWTDDARAFSQNEVAINWNAPLVWVTAFLDDTRSRK